MLAKSVKTQDEAGERSKKLFLKEKNICVFAFPRS